MKKFIVYFLQFVAILSAMLLLVCMASLMLTKDSGVYKEWPLWLDKLFIINCFAEPVLCVLALVALGDLKKDGRKTTQKANGDGNIQIYDYGNERNEK